MMLDEQMLIIEMTVKLSYFLDAAIREWSTALNLRRNFS